MVPRRQFQGMWAARSGAGKKSSRAERWAGVAEKGWSWAERGAGGRVAGPEWGAGITEIGLSADNYYDMIFVH